MSEGPQQTVVNKAADSAQFLNNTVSKLGLEKLGIGAVIIVAYIVVVLIIACIKGLMAAAVGNDALEEAGNILLFYSRY